jgi:hypothetical protein
MITESSHSQLASASDPTKQESPDVAEKALEPTSAQPEKPSFPEGGLAAWTVVLGSSITLGCAFGYLSAFG